MWFTFLKAAVRTFWHYEALFCAQIVIAIPVWKNPNKTQNLINFQKKIRWWVSYVIKTFALECLSIFIEHYKINSMQLQQQNDAPKNMYPFMLIQHALVDYTLVLWFSDSSQNDEPVIVQLVKGSVEEVKFKGHDLCLKLTSTINGEKQIYLSFTDVKLYNRWLRRCKKVWNLLLCRPRAAVSLTHYNALTWSAPVIKHASFSQYVSEYCSFITHSCVYSTINALSYMRTTIRITVFKFTREFYPQYRSIEAIE